ncbi:uncharacterized protein LOC115774424 [Archocentrus centrarchus]|uniref:uncharacterized protein LOC115774424 n=1 Tax=Archocentrus centrarchus TaxID=63155 RepID=UPI0011EA1579|nr:uncharacterized protein LOC115774424 [Archocentrus centrarchus]
MDSSVLFKEIKDRDEMAASALKNADLSTDADLQSLTREDLRDLFPGLKNFKRRKLVSDIVHKQKPIDVVTKDLKDFIPDEYLGGTLISNGVVVDYLKDLKTEMTKVQNFLDVHINLLEKFCTSQPPQDQDKGSSSSISHGSGPMKCHNSQTSNSSQIGGCGSTTSSPSKFPALSFWTPSQKPQATVTYKMVVSGKTFDAHRQLLDKVKASSGETDLILINQEECQSNQDYMVVIVFCPVVSRIGTDAETALKNVTDRKPVILVFMHHIHAAKSVTAPRTWDTSSNVILCAHVFYHETVHGLLQCHENNAAITEIRQALISHSDKTSAKTSENTEKENRNWMSKFLKGK